MSLLASWTLFVLLGFVVPGLLMVFQWRRARSIQTLTIPLAGLVVLALSLSRDIRWVLLGADYSHRLYVTIMVLIAATLINAIYSGFRRAWFACAASALISAFWFFVGAVNTAV